MEAVLPVEEVALPSVEQLLQEELVAVDAAEDLRTYAKNEFIQYIVSKLIKAREILPNDEGDRRHIPGGGKGGGINL